LLALIFIAPQGLQGFIAIPHGFIAIPHGFIAMPQGFLAPQGLQGFIFAAQGLLAHGFFIAQGLHGLAAATCIIRISSARTAPLISVATRTASPPNIALLDFIFFLPD